MIVTEVYLEFSGLTGTSPIFPKKQKSEIYTALPYLMREAGYYTIALEESDVTYYLDSLLPSIGIEKVVFNLGITNIKNYIKTNDFDKPVLNRIYIIGTCRRTY